MHFIYIPYFIGTHLSLLLSHFYLHKPLNAHLPGQKVEILLVNVNEAITTYIATPDIVAYFTEPLADMTVHIAENEELANRIKLFVEPALVHENDDSSKATPSSETTSSAIRLLQRPILPVGFLLLWTMILKQVV